MENYNLHHVGIVFMDMKRAENFIERVGAKEEYRGYVDSYKAWCIFLAAQNGSKVELIIPTEGVLTRFNNGKGGIHHIAYSVADVEKVREEYEKQGIELLEKKAVPGAGNIIVNFMRPRDAYGVLVEFVQTVRD